MSNKKFNFKLKKKKTTLKIYDLFSSRSKKEIALNAYL